MDPLSLNRRRSPQWVRDMPSNSLHGLAGRLLKDAQTEDLSERQEWLWLAVISELEYRRRTASSVWSSCSCQFCIPPFDD